ncbi:MAG: hypothetical protein D6798_07855 [Deltaproteobacteria bacterium]|nr:MAG: hypothetical protein D6798_07855 [Deltaproteobacteria bacterium]
MTLIPVILALACTDKGSDSGGAPIVDDTGATETVGPCGPWTAIWQVDARWTWQIDEAYTKQTEISGAWLAEVDKTETFDGVKVYVYREDISLNVPGHERWDDQFEYRFICDERGVSLLQWEALYDHSTASREDQGFWSAEFTEAQLLWPYDIQVGDTWGFDQSFYFTTSGGETTRPLTVTMSAVDETTVTVPAGTFDVLKIESTWSSDPRHDFEEWSTTSYIARNVGEVKIEGYANLTSWEPGQAE